MVVEAHPLYLSYIYIFTRCVRSHGAPRVQWKNDAKEYIRAETQPASLVVSFTEFHQTKYEKFVFANVILNLNGKEDRQKRRETDSSERPTGRYGVTVG